MNHSTLYLIPVLAVLPACLEAQITVSGTVIDATPKPVEYCNIRLFGDSLMVGGTVSNEKGKFSIDTSAPGDYRLVVSAVGYRSDTLCLSGLDRSRRLGNIVLEEDEILLDSVTVTGRRIVRSIDRQSIYPNSLEKRTANNGAELLRNMSLPTLDIDVEQKSLKLTNGNAVEVRINGVPAKIEEIYAIDPSEILRIEYYDNSGVRLQNAGGIVDFIVKRRNSGGSVYATAGHTFNLPRGWFQTNDKFNFGKSQIKFGYDMFYATYKEQWTDSETDFNFPDGEVVKLKEVGVPAASHQHNGNASLTYNYTDIDRRVFDARVSASLKKAESRSKSCLYYSDLPDYEFFNSYYRMNSPLTFTGELFYKEYLPAGQNISASFGGYYNRPEFLNTISEENTTSGGTDEFHSITDITGSEYGLSARVDYEKRSDAVSFYSGMEYNRSFSDCDYTGTFSDNSRMSRDYIYGYAQMNGKANKFSYMAEFGGYGEFYESDDDSRSNFLFRAGLQLAYNFSDKSRMEFNSSLRNVRFSLSALNDAERYFNRYSVIKGNPGIESKYGFSNSLSFTHRHKYFSLYLRAMNDYVNGEPSLVGSYDAVRRLFVYTMQTFDYVMVNSLSAVIKADIVPQMLSINLTGNLLWYRYKNLGQIYKYFAPSGKLGMYFSKKNWDVYIGMYTRGREVSWNKISYDWWPSDLIQLSYRYKGLSVSLFGNGLMFPGVKCNFKTVSNDPYTPGESITYDASYMPNAGIAVTWFFNWGKSSKNESHWSKLKTESGIL